MNKTLKIICVVTTLALFSAPTFAAKTMSLVDEYRDGSRKICVYSDGRNTATVSKPMGGACHSKHTER